MQRTIAEMKAECRRVGIELDPEHKYSRADLILLLSLHFLNIRIKNGKPPSWALTERMSMDSPALCFSYKNLKEEQKETVMTSDRWVAEQKINGCRCLVYYHPKEGFSFFSRDISVTDYIPIEYTEKILLIHNGIVKRPSDFIGVYGNTFILDCEILARNNIDTTFQGNNRGVVTGQTLNATVALLAYDASMSHKIQMEQSPLDFIIFDVLEYKGHYLYKKPLEKRMKLREKIAEAISKTAPFQQVKYTIEGKEEFYQELIQSGFEGVVLKNMDAEYIPTTSRPRNVMVKRKVSMSQKWADVDLFISGFLKASKGKGWDGYIGALRLSTFIKKLDGEEVEHWIATSSGIPMDMRRQMTSLDLITGEPILKQEFYGKVLKVDGQDITHRSKRFAHAVICWETGFRFDKTKHDCIIDENDVGCILTEKVSE